jgi:hypothetical protein
MTEIGLLPVADATNFAGDDVFSFAVGADTETPATEYAVMEPRTAIIQKNLVKLLLLRRKSMELRLVR